MDGSRRQFLRTAGGMSCACGALSLVESVSAAENVIFRGRLLSYEGNPVTNKRLYGYQDADFDVYTDDEGRFSERVESSSTVGIGLYKQSSSGTASAVKNGVPHVYNIGSFDVGPDGRDLGELQLPEAHLVKMRALDSNGDPVSGATPDVRHNGLGIGSHWMSTDSDGWAYLEDTDIQGIELTGRVKLSMAIPVDGGSMSYKTDALVSEPKTAVFQIGEGSYVTDTSPESTTSKSASTDTQTRTSTQSTSTQSKSNDATTAVESSTASRSETTPSTMTPQPSTAKRGFLSNSPDAEDLGPLNNPLVLTVGGFALSAAGIAHSMIRGY